MSKTLKKIESSLLSNHRIKDGSPLINTTLKDLEFCYQVFLGRDWEITDQQQRESDSVTKGRTKKPIGQVVGFFVSSVEFWLVVCDPIMANRPLGGPIFEEPPTADLRNWIQTRVPLSPEGQVRIAQAASWYDVHIVFFSDPQFRRDVLGMKNATLKDLEFCYRIFLGREWELSDRQQRISDEVTKKRTQEPIGQVVRAFISSMEFRLAVYDPMMADQPACGPIFEEPPTADLRNWIQTRLPLSPEGQAQIARATSWYDVHAALFFDPQFRRDALGMDAAALEFSLPPLPPLFPADPRLQDIKSLCQLFLGCEWGVIRLRSDRPTLDLSAAIENLIHAFITSAAFLHAVYDRMIAGKIVRGSVFDEPPTVNLLDWAKVHLPLSPEGRIKIAQTATWYDLHMAILSDVQFRRDVPGADILALGLASAPAPAAAQVDVCLDDIGFFYEIFLGREWVPMGEEKRAGISWIGASFSDVASIFISSDEFDLSVLAPMLAGSPVSRPVFDSLPTIEQCKWAAARLPLSPAGQARVREAAAWYDLHIGIFSDALFQQTVSDQTGRCLLLSATVPPDMALVTAGEEGVAFIYEIFLGRPWEIVDQKQWATNPWADLTLGEILRTFIGSGEFEQNILIPMMAGRSLGQMIFNSPPSLTYRNWAAVHLPLLPTARRRLERVSHWYELYCVIFSDPLFRRSVLYPDALALALNRAPMPLDLQAAVISASLLFERDWYLATYHDVAAAGGDPLQHYLMHGIAEGRNPNRLFDSRWYLSVYPQAYRNHMNPLVHYITVGATLGYDPHPFMSAKDLLATYPETEEGDLLPLARFLRRISESDPRFPQFGAYDVYRAIQRNERQSYLPEMLRHIEVLDDKPAFVVLITGDGQEEIAATLDSLNQQIYPHARIAWSVAEVQAIAAACDPKSTYFLWLDAGDQLDPDALYVLASALEADPDLALIYFDHDVLVEHGLKSPRHKPGWSPDYFETFDYIGSAACFDIALAADLLPIANGPYDFRLRFTELTTAIKHVDQVLLTSQSDNLRISSTAQEVEDLRAVQGRLARTGRQGQVTTNIPGMRSLDVKIELQSHPLVSIIIPTAARVINYDGRMIDLIVSCLETITARSSYKNIEFVLVDNGDFDRNRIQHIPLERVKFVTYTGAEVNIARKINIGAAAASGEFFLILNDDTEPLTSDWIERLLGHFEKPYVGAVGAKLLYPNGTIQHAGMVYYDGHPVHVRRGEPRNDIGHAFSTCGVRNYMSVTGAAQMVRATTFRSIGGYSEDLPIDYNDVDFSYKIFSIGHSVVYEPKSELIHYESVSAIRSPRPQDVHNFWKKWSALTRDPFYNARYFKKSNPPAFDLFYNEECFKLYVPSFTPGATA